MQLESLIIKKYANRKLYNTETSKYITLDELMTIMKDGREIRVFNTTSTLKDFGDRTKTHTLNEDITIDTIWSAAYKFKDKSLLEYICQQE